MTYINIPSNPVTVCPPSPMPPPSNFKNLYNSQYTSITSSLEIDSKETRQNIPSNFYSDKYAQYLAKKKGNSLRQFINDSSCNC